MKIKFLGTGTSQGIPVIGCNCKICKSKDKKDIRLRSSIYIKYKNQNFVVDTGPDFRQQVLTNNIKKIDFVLYTHAHRDHTSGIDELRSFNFIQKIYRESDLLIDAEVLVIPVNTLGKITKIPDELYIFLEKLKN